VKVLLLSTYDLGHQPFALASLAAWLRAEDADVSCCDQAVDMLDESAAKDAGLICIHLAMHTATRLALEILPRLRQLNPAAHICFFGLYAAANEAALAGFAPASAIAGEFEAEITKLYQRLAGGDQSAEQDYSAIISKDKFKFRQPDRSGLPPLDGYAHLKIGDEKRIAGYTEASRGCKHLCSHCPVVPVYGGWFRPIPLEVVMGDIGTQVGNGAQHITFGDPDFFNGPAHAERVVMALKDTYPDISYDVTIKVEHLLKQKRRLKLLKDTGCLFVTTAVEAADDRILDILAKGHTRADFIEASVLAGEIGLTLSPTFVAFTPWTTLEIYFDLLRLIAELGLVEQVAPVQLAIRLLVPDGSLLKRHPEMLPYLGAFSPERLSYQWQNPDNQVEKLQMRVQALAELGEDQNKSRSEIFSDIWQAAADALGIASLPPALTLPQSPVPCMSEPWYCCAEPTEAQRARL